MTSQLLDYHIFLQSSSSCLCSCLKNKPLPLRKIHLLQYLCSFNVMYDSKLSTGLRQGPPNKEFLLGPQFYSSCMYLTSCSFCPDPKLTIGEDRKVDGPVNRINNASWMHACNMYCHMYLHMRNFR